MASDGFAPWRSVPLPDTVTLAHNLKLFRPRNTVTRIRVSAGIDTFTAVIRGMLETKEMADFVQMRAETCTGNKSFRSEIAAAP